jgi:hypothetical protein
MKLAGVGAVAADLVNIDQPDVVEPASDLDGSSSVGGGRKVSQDVTPPASV